MLQVAPGGWTHNPPNMSVHTRAKCSVTLITNDNWTRWLSCLQISITLIFIQCTCKCSLRNCDQWNSSPCIDPFRPDHTPDRLTTKVQGSVRIALQLNLHHPWAFKAKLSPELYDRLQWQIQQFPTPSAECVKYFMYMWQMGDRRWCTSQFVLHALIRLEISYHNKGKHI